jgi:LysM repeat protein
VRAADGFGNFATKRFNFTIDPETRTAQEPVAFPVADQVVNRGSTFYVNPYFQDANGGTLTYTKAMADGSAWPSWMSFDATTGKIVGNPPATLAAKTYLINITATDATGLSATVTAKVDVVVSGAGSNYLRSVWFAYDANDRVTVVNGIIGPDGIVLGTSYEQAPGTPYASSWASFGQGYDANGNVIATYSRDIEGLVSVTQSVYNLRGQVALVFQERSLGVTDPSAGGTAYWGSNVAEQRTYDAEGHLLESRSFYGYDKNYGGTTTSPGWIKRADVYTYDDDGRLATQKTYQRLKGWAPVNDSNQTLAYQSAASVTSFSNPSPLSLIATTTLNYDSLGRQGTSTYAHVKWAHSETTGIGTGIFTHTFTRTYLARDAFLEQKVTGNSTDNTNYRATTVTSTYDAYGRRTSVKDDTTLSDYKTSLTRMRYLGYDAGQGILTRREGEIKNGVFTQADNGLVKVANLNQHYLYSNGQQIARADDSGNVDALSGLTAYDPVAELSDATVQTGDTLQNVSQRVYGSSSYWYVLAAANGLQKDDQLVAGTTLKVPAVTVAKNDATTFKPYNPADVIGSTTPNLPYIKPAPPSGCSAVATLIRIAAVVACVFAPVAFAPLIAGGGEFLGQTAEIVQGYRSGYDVGAIGASALLAYVAPQIKAPTTAWGRAGLAAAQSAGASLASTAINEIVGNENHFSWRGVAAGAVTAAIGTRLFGNSPRIEGSNVPNPGAQGSFNWAKVAAQSLTRQVIGYGVSKAIVGEGHWNWGNVAGVIGSDVATGWAQSATSKREAARIRKLTTEELLDWRPSIAVASNEEVGSFLERYPNALAANDGPMPMARKLEQPMLDAGSLSNSAKSSVSVYADPEAVAIDLERMRAYSAELGPQPEIDSDIYIGMVSGHGNEESAAFDFSGVPGMREMTASAGVLYGIGRSAYQIGEGLAYAADDLLIGAASTFGLNSGFSNEAADRTGQRIQGLVNLIHSGHVFQEIMAPMGERRVTGADLIINGQGFEGGARIGEGFTQIGLMLEGGAGTARGMVSLAKAADAAGILPVLSRSGPRPGGQIGAVGDLQSQVVPKRAGTPEEVANTSESVLSRLSPNAQRHIANYQARYDARYSQLRSQLESGDLELPGHLNQNAELGNLTDKLVRRDMRMSLVDSGLTEGRGQAIQVNRNVYDPEGSGAYVRPDYFLRDEGIILDGTIGMPKPLTATQIQGYIDFAKPNYVIEIGPYRVPRIVYSKLTGE